MINKNLFNAVETGNAAKVEKVLTEEKINAATYYGVKSILLAAKQGNCEILKMLLESGKRVDRKSFWERSAQYALSEAVRSENIEMIRLLLEYGAGTDKKELHNALIEAILIENQEMIDLLRTAGARLNIQSPIILLNPKLREMLEAITTNDLPKIESILDDGFTSEMINILLRYSADFSLVFDNQEMMKLFQAKGFLSLPKGYSNDDLLIINAKIGNNKRIQALFDEGVSEKSLFSAVDAALKNNHWESAMILAECKNFPETDIYTECLKKIFLKAAYIEDTEKVKFYLEKLIENVVGVLTDESGKSTLEIALESDPQGVVKILSNYNFSENALRYAFKYLIKI